MSEVEDKSGWLNVRVDAKGVTTVTKPVGEFKALDLYGAVLLQVMYGNDRALGEYFTTWVKGDEDVEKGRKLLIRAWRKMGDYYHEQGEEKRRACMLAAKKAESEDAVVIREEKEGESHD